MKVILVNDVEKLGKMGDLVNVKEGYARNYLFPKNLAINMSKTKSVPLLSASLTIRASVFFVILRPVFERGRGCIFLSLLLFFFQRKPYLAAE